jgi:hypothetical protein
MTKRLLPLILLSLVVWEATRALPRFASRTNFSCQSCHVNPSGGGMRNTFGVTYGREEITLASLQEEFGLDDFTTKINEFISYGVDFRFLAFYQSKDNPDESRSSFFPMQADVYLNLAISKRIAVFANPAFGPFNRYEIFGIARVLPFSGYLKAGRFTPPYGLRLDDHTSYVREATPFRNNSGQQTGIEVGLNPGGFTLLGGLTNGVVGDRDRDVAKAVLGRAEARLAVGPANVMLGVSTYNDVSAAERYNIQGAYGALTLFERFTVVGDVERMQGNSALMGVSGDRLARNTQNRQLKQFATMVEASLMITPGVDLKLMYDFFDPNTDVKGGSVTRYSGGLEFFPINGVEIRPLLRFTKDDVLNRKTTDVHVLFHLYL